MRTKLSVLLLSAFFICIIGVTPSLAEKKESKQDKEISVYAEKVTKHNLREIISVSGDIKPFAEITVYSKVSGEIQKIAVEKGQFVKKGDAIAVIEHESDLKKLASMKIAVELAKLGLEQAELGIKSSEATITQINDQLEQAVIGEKLADSGLLQAEAQVVQAKAGVVAAEAGVSRAKAQYENALLEKERAENLLKDNAIPKQRYDGIIAQFEAAKSGLDAANAQLDASKSTVKLAEEGINRAKMQIDSSKIQLKLVQSNLELAKIKLNASIKNVEQTKASMENAQLSLDQFQIRIDDYTIIAPISGVISQRLADVGAMNTPQAPLFVITNMETVKVFSQVSDAEIAKINNDVKAIVSVDSYPDEKFEGNITIIDPSVDPRTRTLGFEIHLKNEKHLLKPGMFARIELITKELNNVIAVPKSAVLSTKKEQYVYVVEDNMAVKKTVETGLQEGPTIEITKGLTGGETLVIEGAYYLNDGTKVKIQEKK